jgi:serine/threonine-protein kinase
VAAASAAAPRGPDWTRAVLALGQGALEGLAVLHGKNPGIVHRDVSPENLLVSPDGGVAILDLGVALVGATPLDEPIGKRAYMSPEHLAGLAVDGRADLYGLGVVLWELLSGVRPHGALGSDGRLPPLSSVAPWVDRTSARLVSRLLEPAPGDRPAKARVAREAFAARLRRVGVSDPREPVRRALDALFDADTRVEWTPDPEAWSERRYESAEERGEETTDRQATRYEDITEIVAPIIR